MTSYIFFIVAIKSSSKTKRFPSSPYPYVLKNFRLTLCLTTLIVCLVNQGMKSLIKGDMKKIYSKMMVSSGNTNYYCCIPSEYPPDESSTDATKLIDYDQKDTKSILQESILGVGRGAPINHANIKEVEVVVDLDSEADIDVFLAAKPALNSGKSIGIDMADQMLGKSRESTTQGNYSNVEFRKGDTEVTTLLNHNSADAVIGNYAVNPTTSKINTLKEAFRILRKNVRMMISDLVAGVKLLAEKVSSDQRCECIDGGATTATTTIVTKKENRLSSVKEDGFDTIKILEERQNYTWKARKKINGRKISGLAIKAIR